VWAWGWNQYGGLGNGTTTNSSVPVQVSGLTGVTAIASGASSGYALRSDGTVWAWGYNYNGELGNGTTTNSTVPAPVSGLTGVAAIAGGNDSAYELGGVIAPVGGAVSARELLGAVNPCLPCAAKSAHKPVADPVDTASGGYTESFVDLAISGRGPQAVWARSYASVMAADDGPLGFGWHTGYGAGDVGEKR
jgi:hypothetical protein